MVKGKKGAEMTVGTLVVIVLAIIVLVVLVLGFSTGWKDLWGRITAFFGGANVGTIVQACTVACQAGNKYDFCTRERTITAEDKRFSVNVKGEIIGSSAEKLTPDDRKEMEGLKKIKDSELTDAQKTRINVLLDKIDKDSERGKATCYELAQWYSASLEFKECPDIDCSGAVAMFCGNNKKEGTELCDGTDLDGKKCEDITVDGKTFTRGGTLACKSDCTWNVEGCTPVTAPAGG